MDIIDKLKDLDKYPFAPTEAMHEIKLLRELVSDLQDNICSGVFDMAEHAKLMNRVNAALSAAAQTVAEGGE